MRYFIAFLFFVHGLIHFIGLAKALGLSDVITKSISKPAGYVWLLVGLLFIVSSIGYLVSYRYWPIVAIVTVVISQALIIQTWSDARYGTILNIIILTIAVLAQGSILFEATYKQDVSRMFKKNLSSSTILKQEDINHLPIPVQKYLIVTGAVGQPRVKNVRIVFEGQMRSKDKDWFPFTTEQYNFFDDPTRLFFMKAKMFGVTVPGYHRYVQGKASMDIRLFGMIPVSQSRGDELNQAETVTVFNDMCILVPASLIDTRITWETINDHTVKAVFANNEERISAVLYFNDAGELTNFTSDDRFDLNAGKQFRFSTPMKDYKNYGGNKVPAYGEAVWHYPEGEFVYGKFHLKSIEYNVVADNP